MFGAVGIPAVGSRCDELVDVLGMHERVQLLGPGGSVAAMRFRAPDGTWRSQHSPLRQTGDPEDLAELQPTFGASDEGMERLGTFYLSILSMTEEEVEGLDDVGTLAFLRPFGLPTGLESQILATLNLHLVVPVDRLAATEGVFVLRQVVLGGAGRFHNGGCRKVAEACAPFVAEHGGEFVRSTRVDAIEVEDGRATGVRTGGRVLRAPKVVSNAGIQPTMLKLVGAGHFPSEYVAMVEGLEPSWGIAGLGYVLDDRVLDAVLTPEFSDQSWLDSERFAAMEAGEWPDVPLTAIDVANEFDSTLVAEPGHQVANIQVFASSDPASPMADGAVRWARMVVADLWPELERHTLWFEPYGSPQISRMTRDATVPDSVCEAVGVTQVFGQVGRSKPDPRTPLPRLFLVGCNAGGRGAGTHQAVDSALRVAELVSAELG
jgi:phytoene dehydrogenase-like protein